MNLNSVHNVYFIGIGGIGMSALARYFVAKGKLVSGYDRMPSEITKALQGLGVSIHFDDDVEHINSTFLNAESTLVVYTPAIPDSHSELRYFKTHNFKVLKRSVVLGEITKQTICLAVAGTHGKTTTTSILGHILNECNAPVTAFLGGVSENYNSNLIINGTEVTVVEADEFDRSFLTLSPDLACITSMDADHLDIYGDASALIKSFKDFTACIKPNGKLFVRNGLPLKGITYGVEDDSDYSAQNVKIENGSYVFDVKTPKGLYNVREMYPKQKVLAIFQPHLFTRTRDFIDDFAKNLSKFDELLLLDIYPARELPIEGVTSKWLLDKINNSNKKLIQKSELINEIKKSDAQIVLTIGAGDIGKEVKNIKQAFSIED